MSDDSTRHIVTHSGEEPLSGVPETAEEGGERAGMPPEPRDASAHPIRVQWQRSWQEFLTRAIAIFFETLLAAVFILAETALFTMVELLTNATLNTPDDAVRKGLDLFFAYIKIAIGGFLALVMLV